jgi:phosphoribosylanthranilate isomerase
VTIKVCGITRAEDAAMATALGVHALGFVFWASSPRAMTPERARAIIDGLPPFVTPVGVFVDPSDDLVLRCRDAGVQLAQIVGAVPVLPSGMRALRVVSLNPEGTGLVPDVPSSEPVLVDTHDPVRRGGTGRTMDWHAVSALTRGRQVVLAGGLRADNVGDAIRLVRPVGVDVSSGVESAPGVKDHQKLAAFVAAVRDVA